MTQTDTAAGRTWADDLALILSFAARRRVGVGDPEDGGDEAPAEGAAVPLIEPDALGEFVRAAADALAPRGRGEVMRRALGFMTPAPGEAFERTFLVLFAALESALTYARGDDEYEIIPREEFARLEGDLKDWLKAHPALAADAGRRALLYEKTRELNRLPFSRVYALFCERRGVEVSDLWPLTGRLDGWPLLQIRHRLVHGDPFPERPGAALACAVAHLRWTAERLLLAAMGWPVERSNVSPRRLAGLEEYRSWPAERGRLGAAPG